MRDRHQLSNIIVDTKAWDLMDISNKHPHGDPAIFAARHHSLRLLLRFRGLEAATVVPGEWVNENDAEVLAKAMMMKEGRSTREVQDYDEELEGDLASMLEGPLVPKGRYLMG